MEPSPWTFEGEVAGGGLAGTVTAVNQTAFSLSRPNGDVDGSFDGLFVLDRRILSRLRVLVDGAAVQALGWSVEGPVATFVGRVPPVPGVRARPTLAVTRRREVGRHFLEHLEVRNYGDAERTVEVRVEVEGDLADLFAVKEQRVQPSALRQVVGPDIIVIGATDEPPGEEVEVTTVLPADVRDGSWTWTVRLPPRKAWRTRLGIILRLDGRAVAEPEQRVPPGRFAGTPDPWRATRPRLRTDDASLAAAVAKGLDDLSELRLTDPDHPEDLVVAAGAPWFMTLFGRDALFTSLMAMPFDPDLAVGVLRTLARFQGRRTDPGTEEEPGRILHEIRFQDRGSSSFGEGQPYFGSVDATPLFVVLLGELLRWGTDPEAVRELLPAADRAMAWIEARQADGPLEGLVAYGPASAGGLANQGWKDSWDAVSHTDGRLAPAPLAVCEVQAVTYAAMRARSELAGATGDPTGSSAWLGRASELQDRFLDRFVHDGRIAMAVDGTGRPVLVESSNALQCLWTGVVPSTLAEIAAHDALAPGLFSGWGLRTLATTERRYDPVSYHNGSVWPHDTALAVWGLARTGQYAAAETLGAALLEASGVGDDGLPELFAGFSRARIGVPAAYPAACRPQAWSAAAPLLVLRALLGLEPDLPRGAVGVRPTDRSRSMVLEGVRMGAELRTVTVAPSRIQVHPPVGPP